MFRIQHKIDGIFVDIDVIDSIDYSNLYEVKEYLKLIRQDRIIYRIFSVRYEKLPQKEKKAKKGVQKEIKIKKIEIKKNKEIETKKLKRFIPP